MVDVMSLDVTHALQRAGLWDAALAIAPTPQRRAEILVDRHIWRVDAPDGALAAVAEIRALDPALSILLRSQIVYWHKLLKLGPPDAYGADDPVDGFAEAAKEPRLAGWATFWQAVATEALRKDLAGAEAGYESARLASKAAGDRLLESYAVRHLGALLIDIHQAGAIQLLRRSLQLRAACGARPHVAAAQALLADTLGSGPECDELREIAATTAAELGLTWLLPKEESQA
jgi:hypothetical protein